MTDSTPADRGALAAPADPATRSPRPPIRATRAAPDAPGASADPDAASVVRLATPYRTHTCGALRAADAGATARLSGWVHRRRDHGQLIFLDLRDRHGITQVVDRQGGRARRPRHREPGPERVRRHRRGRASPRGCPGRRTRACRPARSSSGRPTSRSCPRRRRRPSTSTTRTPRSTRPSASATATSTSGARRWPAASSSGAASSRRSARSTTPTASSRSRRRT